MATSIQKELHVIFGTGPLGMAVMRELASRGKRVRMVNTRGQADVPSGVEVIKGDACSIDSTTELTCGAAVVYQCAMPPYTEWLQKFPPMQAAILEGAARNKAKLVIGDNLYMYGEVNGRIHEGLPYAAQTRKGRLRAQMAENALAAHQAGKVRVALGRGSDFFGPGVLASSIGKQAIRNALQGKQAQLLGKLDVPHTFTYIDDFGKALVILGEREEALGQAWHVPNDSPVTQRELMTFFFEEIGKPPKMVVMRGMLMSMVGMFSPVVREMKEMMYALDKPYIVDSSKFEQAFQMKATPLREAVRRTVEWYRAHP
ncbi:NAD-dependent epimerase/dehydratase family protein [Candidatus Nitrotoga sp. 1052]|uniref:NAD-dependent epimerase/dehydratase family protein n=1 Tax=Candidatus Nitrotoga sp. 1052 TaxID=2886964 RepID=UPI001EF59E8F|nr:NAD-dependent epimerase/dehydratase family protein [Candidatus Nitrotoga sp. 1052]CAH1091750.1 NAD-dependent dehydratase [Candidatus Nitrotoga sp. 1052]